MGETPQTQPADALWPAVLYACQLEFDIEDCGQADVVFHELAPHVNALVAKAEKRSAEELQRRIDVVLAWHNPVESEYRDAAGNATRTVTECAHCSTLADDGIDWPCATASALGAASGEVTR